ncbi:MAG: hypothetical protein E7167_03375 [Firmicutes bacterium]|nr:hypothetical protein [Bacillota bacterium]
MKKRILLTALLSTLFVNVLAVNASTCSYSERAQLNKDVAGIKVIYEEKTALVDPDLYDCQEEYQECTSEYDYFTISVLNMTEDFYFTVENNVDKTKSTYYYTDAVDGVISFDWEGILDITTFTFEVYSSNETSCPRDRYRTIYLTTPRKNLYHYYGQCQNDPDYYLCQKYVTFEDISFYDFVDKMEERAAKLEQSGQIDKELNFFEKVIDFINDNRTAFIIGGALIVVGAVVAVIIVKKRKKSVL